MEIFQSDNKLDKSANADEVVELNNTLIKRYKSYNIYSQDVTVRGEKKFIGALYHDEEPVLRIEYIVLGSFSKEKNVWIWADQSQSVNKNTKIEISALRLRGLEKENDVKSSESIKDFLSQNYTVLSTKELSEKLYWFAGYMATQKNNTSVILTSNRGKNIDVMIVKKVLFNNIK